jgi:hypothetical protein
MSLQAKFASKALHSNLEVFLGLGQRAGEAMRHAFLKTHKDFRDVRPSPPMPLPQSRLIFVLAGPRRSHE